MSKELLPISVLYIEGIATVELGNVESSFEKNLETNTLGT